MNRPPQLGAPGVIVSGRTKEREGHGQDGLTGRPSVSANQAVDSHSQDLTALGFP